MDNVINILIVDDHTIFLEAISALFQDEDSINVSGLVKDGQEALNFLQHSNVDVLLCDVTMPGMDGIELSKVIQKRYPAIKIIILTTHSNPDIINKLMKYNIRGYLLKNAAKEELVLAINKVMAGENYYSQSVKDSYVNSVFKNNFDEQKEPQLSRREKEIIKYIVREYTTEEIAEKLVLSQHTVKTHRKNILAKLGLKNIAGLVKYAMQNGLGV